MTGQMTAWAIDEFSAPDRFLPVTLPIPVPRSAELLITVRASSVNPVDYKIRNGSASFFAHPFPALMHPNCAAAVRAVGSAAALHASGDAVFTLATGIGGKARTLADYVVADAARLSRAPQVLSHDETETLPLLCSTAWLSRIEQGGVVPRQTVPVECGTGGVGHLALEVPRWRGRRVCAMCGSTDKCRTAERLGAERDYENRGITPDEFDSLATVDRGRDIVNNTPCRPSMDHAVTEAAFGGTIVETLVDFPVRPGLRKKWLRFCSAFAGPPILTGEGPERIADARAYVEHGRPTAKVVQLVQTGLDDRNHREPIPNFKKKRSTENAENRKRDRGWYCFRH